MRKCVLFYVSLCAFFIRCSYIFSLFYIFRQKHTVSLRRRCRKGLQLLPEIGDHGHIVILECACGREMTRRYNGIFLTQAYSFHRCLSEGGMDNMCNKGTRNNFCWEIHPARGCSVKSASPPIHSFIPINVLFATGKKHGRQQHGRRALPFPAQCYPVRGLQNPHSVTKNISLAFCQ